MKPYLLVPVKLEGLESIAESLLSEVPEQDTSARSNGVFSVQSLADCWRVHHVKYRDKFLAVDLAKQLLDSGNSKTQDDWAEFSRQAKTNNQFYVADFPLYHGIFSTLFNNKENSQHKKTIDEMRSFIKKQMFDYWLMTLTRAQYKKTGKDRVIHNQGMLDKYELDAEIMGKEGFVKDSNTNAQHALASLLWDDNLQHVQDAYHWLTGKDAYLYRVNSKQNAERVAGFVASSGRAGLGCDGNPGYSGRALGVRVAREK